MQKNIRRPSATRAVSMKDNKNRAMKEEQRGRIAWTQSLSGDQLRAFEQLYNTRNMSNEDLSRLICSVSREALEIWIHQKAPRG